MTTALQDSRLLRGLIRHRYLAVSGFIAVLTALSVTSWTTGTDWPLLSRGADALVSSRWASTYVSVHGLQAGPLSLLLVRVLDAVTSGHGVVLAHLLLAAELPVLLRLAEDAAASTGVPLQRRHAGVLAVGLMVAPVWADLSGDLPHVDDGLALLGALLALRFVARQQGWQAALCCGVAVDAKPWAIGAVAMLFGLPARRWRAAAIAAVLPVVSWLPLVIGDHGTISAAARIHLVVSADVPLAALHLVVGTAPAWLRTAQLLGIAGTALLVGRRGGWAVAFGAAMAVRLALDPANYGYYYAGTLIAVGAGELATGSAPWRTGILWTGYVLAQPMPVGGRGIAHLVALLVVVADLLRGRPGRRRAVASLVTWPRPTTSRTA